MADYARSNYRSQPTSLSIYDRAPVSHHLPAEQCGNAAITAASVATVALVISATSVVIAATAVVIAATAIAIAASAVV